MSGLLRAEFSRLRSRRLTWAVLGFVLIITGLTLYGTYQTSRQFTPAAIAEQKAQLKQAHDDWVKNHVQQDKDCRSSYVQSPGQPPADEVCNNPDPASAQSTYYGGGEGSFGVGQPRYDTLFGDGIEQARTFILFFAIVLGAGLVTAEFSSGAMVNWLTFEPRRTRVYASKVAASGAGGLLVGLVGSIPLVLGTWVISESVHLGGPSNAALAVAGRLILVGLGGGIIGSALGFILRNTAAVVGVVVGYVIVVEAILGSAVKQLNPYLLSINVSAFVTGRATWYTEKCDTQPGQDYVSCQSIGHNLYLWHGFVVALIYVALLLTAGLLLFRRRDVT